MSDNTSGKGAVVTARIGLATGIARHFVDQCAKLSFAVLSLDRIKAVRTDLSSAVAMRTV
jgi:hypothetical protein